jgi:hypothetical protein
MIVVVFPLMARVSYHDHGEQAAPREPRRSVWPQPQLTDHTSNSRHANLWVTPLRALAAAMRHALPIPPMHEPGLLPRQLPVASRG